MAAARARPAVLPLSEAGSRTDWLDSAKGIGIVAVVLGHTLGGLIDAQGLPAPAGFRVLFLAIYICHMPLFFFLSGLLVQKRLEKSQSRFAIGVLRSIAWPYFLWSAVQYTVIFGSGSLVNSPVGQLWPALLRLPFATISQFWFLYVLFFLHLAALLIVPRFGGRTFLALSLVGKIVAALIVLPALPRLFLIHGGFYALGLWLGADALEKAKRTLRSPVALAWAISAAAAIAVSLACAWTISDVGDDIWTRRSADLAAMAWHLPTVPASLLGIAACILTAMTVGPHLTALFAYLGRASMAIFVLHVLFVAGARIVLTKLVHIHDPMLLLCAGVPTGLLGPVLVYAATRRFGMTRLLGLGG